MSRASRFAVQERKRDMRRLLLAYYEPWEILAYVSEHVADPSSPWRTRNGVPVAPSTLRAYAAKARTKIAEEAAEGQADALARHVAGRHELIKRCIEAKDYRTALSLLDSLARLQGLTPEGMLAAAVDRATEYEKQLAHGNGEAAAGGRIFGAVPPANGNGSGGH